MSQLSRWGLIILGLLFLSAAGLAQAQEATPEPTPRATPTNDPTIFQTPEVTPTATPSVPPTFTPVPDGDGDGDGDADGERDGDDQKRGTIQGMVYEDVNGDGNCVNTGTEGEGPVANVPVEFVSSDGETVITLNSGPDGRYALVAAGYSFWDVSARPGADWVVTSEATQNVPIFEDSLVATDVNFCVQEASEATVLLPASGGPGSTPFTGVLAIIGLGLILVGVLWQWRPRRQR